MKNHSLKPDPMARDRKPGPLARPSKPHRIGLASGPRPHPQGQAHSQLAPPGLDFQQVDSTIAAEGDDS